jgi:hypothetical protein
MNWNTVQQLIRIVGYSAGAALLGDGVADSEQFQAALGGIISVAAFGWWIVKERSST